MAGAIAGFLLRGKRRGGSFPLPRGSGDGTKIRKGKGWLLCVLRRKQPFIILRYDYEFKRKCVELFRQVL